MTRAQDLARRLRPLATDDLRRAAGGGETASTSTSGTPSAGDDTVGDSGGGRVGGFFAFPGFTGGISVAG